MLQQAKSIRPFIGAQDFETSRVFYKALGFEEHILFHNMSLFKTETLGFYLQKAYVKDWVDNTMLFMEVENVNAFWDYLVSLDLPKRFPNVKLVPIKTYDWGKECFVHDPSGILWHFGEFAK